jgi:hypothetical protein
MVGASAFSSRSDIELNHFELGGKCGGHTLKFKNEVEAIYCFLKKRLDCRIQSHLYHSSLLARYPWLSRSPNPFSYARYIPRHAGIADEDSKSATRTPLKTDLTAASSALWLGLGHGRN